MKTINVVAALIFSTDSNGTKQIFAARRGYGEFQGLWEFPGGKIEPGETPQDALIREISEELATKIKVCDFVDSIEYDYPSFHLSIGYYVCEIINGSLQLLEHENSAWLTTQTLRTVEWLPADVGILDKIENLLQQ